MDYYENLLINPIEFDNENNSKPCPDIYRKYLFNLKNLTLIDDVKQMAEQSKTKLYLWENDTELLDNFGIMLNNHPNLPSYSIADIVVNKRNKSKVKHYYNEIYNIADIIIVKAQLSKNTLCIKDTIMLLFDYFKLNKKLLVAFRLIYYLSVYYVKILKENNGVTTIKFINAIIEKSNEFSINPNIEKYLLKTEVTAYLHFFNSLVEDKE